MVNTYLHNDTFPYSHELGCGPIGYCGSKAAMRTIAKADVVLALGTRLGVFGLLPQYDMTYWPEDATLIQVDRDARQWGMSKIPALFSVADVKEYAVELLDELRKAAAGSEGGTRRASPTSPVRSRPGTRNSRTGLRPPTPSCTPGASCGSSRARCPGTRW